MRNRTNKNQRQPTTTNVLPTTSCRLRVTVRIPAIYPLNVSLFKPSLEKSGFRKLPHSPPKHRLTSWAYRDKYRTATPLIRRVRPLPRAQDITVCLLGFEQHKARPDLGDDSGFWLRIKAEDASPFVAAFKASPKGFHEFRIEQRVGKETRTSALNAQIVKIEEGPAEMRVLLRPHSSYGAAI